MERIICLVIGYAFGLVQTGYIYGRLHGTDIRKFGSGNSGSTNALRVMGKKAGAVVLLGDVAKSVLACLLVRVLFGKSQPDMVPLLVIYAGLGVVLGHNYPFYLKFKGRKGDCGYRRICHRIRRLEASGFRPFRFPSDRSGHQICFSGIASGRQRTLYRLGGFYAAGMDCSGFYIPG